MSKFCVYIIIVLIKWILYSAAFEYPELKLLNVVFRHGDREPNSEKNGDLTKIGRQRAYHLGKALRTRYGDFLDDIYEPAAVSARSTEYARAKMSLQLLLAALYVPQRQQRWHESLAWQPVPFSYVPVVQDILLFPKYCPRFSREIEKAKLSPEFKKRMEPFRDLLKNLTVSTGKKLETPLDMFLLYHSLVSMQSMNKSLPYWAKDIFPDGLLLNGTYLEYDLLKHTDWMRRINGGTLVRKMVEDMLNKTETKWSTQRKIFLYSSHEFIIVAVLQTLNIWKQHIPSYSSAIILELRGVHESYFVRVLYYEGISAKFKEMQIPNCTTLCPLKKFIEVISDQLPTYDEIICDVEPEVFPQIMIV